MITERFCCDEMDAKFERSHRAICEWLGNIHRRDLDTWIFVWMPGAAP